MSENRKVVLIITDSLGIGALPDADKYGDQNADTFGHIVRECGSLNMPNLLSLGWGNIDGVCEGKLAVESPIGCFGKMAEVSAGKDTTTGHWEIAGLKTDVPFKTYPDGFPKEFMDAFAAEIGTECIGNYPASGTAIIEELGPEHEATGKPIVYTSADSVFQIAAHEDVVPVPELYRICEIARGMLQGKHGVGRVIARPFVGSCAADFKRTANRHDYSLLPPRPSMLDELKAAGRAVIGVGKIHDIFAGQGTTETIRTKNNADGMRVTIELADRAFEGLAFVNLVDFDMTYGHRRDIPGYAAAVTEFDRWLPGFMAKLGPEDLVMITADHGCDPGYLATTDHTREYVPWLITGKAVKPGVDLGTLAGFDHIAATVCDALGVKTAAEAESRFAVICGL